MKVSAKEILLPKHPPSFIEGDSKVGLMGKMPIVIIIDCCFILQSYWSAAVNKSQYSTLEHDFYKQYSTVEHDFYKLTTFTS